MIIRLSQKLCTKIKAGKLSEIPPDENPYADWSRKDLPEAHCTIDRHRQFCKGSESSGNWINE